MQTKRQPITMARLLAVLIAPLLALGAVSGAFADQSPYDDEPKAILEQFAQSEENNIVAIFNNADEKFRTKASVDLDVVAGPEVLPVNVAWSQGTCVACKTMTVALQIALYEPGAPVIVPENAAVALNIECPNCFTYARAHQVVLPVGDPVTVAANAGDEIEQLNGEVVQVLINAKHERISTDQAMAEVEALVSELRALATRIDNGEFDTSAGDADGSGDDAGLEEQAMPTQTTSPDSSATQDEAAATEEAASPASPGIEDSAATASPSPVPPTLEGQATPTETPSPAPANDQATPRETPAPAPGGAESQAPAADASPAPSDSAAIP